MNVTIHDVEQRSEAWHALRLGRLTASRAGDMMATVQKGEAASRRNLRVQLMLERITGRSHERGVVTGPMQDGIDREPAATAHYEAVTGTLITTVGFVSHNELMAGCSPDGFVGDDGLVSIKAPIPATHLEYLRTGVVPRDYWLQILHESWLTGRRWCDWLSYQPDFPDGLKAKLVRVEISEATVKDYAEKATAFLKEVDAETQAVRTMADLAGQLKAS